MSRLRGVFAVVPALLVLVSSSAYADPPADSSGLRLPIPEAQRPITLPRLVLAPTVGFDVDQQGTASLFADLDVSGRFGITDDLTVHALAAPLQLSAPGGGGLYYGQTNAYDGPGLGVTYRFVRGAAELGVDLSGNVFTVPHLSGGSVSLAVPLRVHATPQLRLDAVPSVDVVLATETTTDTSANTARVHVPVSAHYDVVDVVDVGLTTGLTVYDVNNARTSTGIPLGVLLGFVIPGAKGPVVDIDPYFTFPYLLLPGRVDVTNSAQYVVGLNVTGYLYL